MCLFRVLQVSLNQASYSDINLIGFSIDSTRFASDNTCLRNIGIKECRKRILLITEINILTRIFGPRDDRDGTRRIETNDELNKLIRNNNKSLI